MKTNDSIIKILLECIKNFYVYCEQEEIHCFSPWIYIDTYSDVVRYRYAPTDSYAYNMYDLMNYPIKYLDLSNNIRYKILYLSSILKSKNIILAGIDTNYSSDMYKVEFVYSINHFSKTYKKELMKNINVILKNIYFFKVQNEGNFITIGEKGNLQSKLFSIESIEKEYGLVIMYSFINILKILKVINCSYIICRLEKEPEICDVRLIKK